MFNKLLGRLKSPTEGVAKSFIRLGRFGFWVQVVLGSIPVVLMIYNFTFSRSPVGPRAGLPVVEYLAVVSLLILIFTAYWFRRYIRLGRAMADPARRPSQSDVLGTVWTGLLASSAGVLVSIGIMLIEVAHLLFYFLSAPQGGVPVIQTTGAAPASWVSAVDMLSLMALLLVLAAELIVMVSGLWLLFRTTRDYDEAA
jgi:ABC-type nickel/cobalt efflux system permease component RcnA